MNKIKRYLSYVLAFSMLAMFPQESLAIEYCTDAGGCAYEDAQQSCSYIPAIGFALVIIAGIVAVGVHNKCHCSHSHSSSTTDTN